MASTLPTKITRFLVAIIIVGVVSYLFYYNPDSIRVNLYPGVIWEAPLALVLVVAFCLGALIMGVVAVVFGLFHAIGDWQFKRRVKTERQGREIFITAREQLATRNLKDAEASFSRIVENEPDNILARVMLAETIKRQGDYTRALRVLDQARAEQKKNIELLVLAAETNELVGNSTACADNLLVLLQRYPDNEFALRKLSDHFAKLEKFDDALAYRKRLLKKLSQEEYDLVQEEIAGLELAKLVRASGSDRDALRTALNENLKRHRDHAPTIAKLADLEELEGKTEAASKLLAKAFQQSKDIKYLQQQILLWLKKPDSERALECAQRAVESSAGEPELFTKARIAQANLLLYCDKSDDAAKVIGAVEDTAPGAHTADLRLLRAAALRKSAKIDEAFALLAEPLTPSGTLTNGTALFLPLNKGGIGRPLRIETIHGRIEHNPPSPNLSTP